MIEEEFDNIETNNETEVVQYDILTHILCYKHQADQNEESS